MSYSSDEDSNSSQVESRLIIDGVDILTKLRTLEATVIHHVTAINDHATHINKLYKRLNKQEELIEKLMGCLESLVGSSTQLAEIYLKKKEEKMGKTQPTSVITATPVLDIERSSEQ